MQSSRHSLRLPRPAPRLAAVLFAGAVASAGVFAAVDDLNAAPAIRPWAGNAPPPAAAPHAGANDKATAALAKPAPAKVAALPPAPEPAAPGHVVNERTADVVARAGARSDAGVLATTPPAEPPLGARWRVLHGGTDVHVPVVSWMADMQPGAGDASIPGSAATKPSVHLSAEWALPGDFSLGVMPGMAVDLDAFGRRVANGTLAVTVGKAWSPQWRTFVDMARDRLAPDTLGDVSTTLDAGITFIAGPATHIAVALTHGLTMAAPPFQAGVGVSSSF